MLLNNKNQLIIDYLTVSSPGVFLLEFKLERKSFFLKIILESYLAHQIQQPMLKQRIVNFHEFVNLPDT